MEFFDRLKQETAQERNALYSLPILVDAMHGRVTKEAHLAHLEQAYHHVKHTLPLLLLMASRLPKEKEWLRRAILHYTNEEVGHEDWILSDIKKIGGEARAEAVRTGEPGLEVELINAFNYDMITRRNPVGYFGMIVVLENASVDLAAKSIANVQKTLGVNDESTSYLSSHSTLDVDHTKEIGELLNKISDPKDQEIIIHACKVIYRLYADMFRVIAQTHARQAA